MTATNLSRNSDFIRVLLDRAYLAILCIAGSLIIFRYSYLITDTQFVSSDFAGHLSVIRLLQENILESRWLFYDHTEFTGWPAFQFYGFFSHLLIGFIAWSLSPIFLLLEPRITIALLIQAAFFPFAVYFAAGSLLPRQSSSTRALVACYSSALAIWFLNHPQAPEAIGAGAFFQMGLVPQLLGWMLFLIHLGFLGRIFYAYKRKQSSIGFVISFALLIITHQLTAAFAVFVGFSFFILFNEIRWRIALLYLIAILISGFWIVPFITHANAFSVSSILPYQGDFLANTFRYPVEQLFTLFSSFELEALAKVELGFVFTIGSAAYILLNIRRVEFQLISSVFLISLFGSILFSSPYIQSSIPFTIHFQRYLGFGICLLLPTFAAWPALILEHKRTSQSNIATIQNLLMFLLPLLITISSFMNPNAIERTWRSLPADFYKEQDLVLEYLKNGNGRVLFENGYDETYFKFPTQHYLESELYNRTGRETVNGLFHNSSISYLFTLISTKALKANMYSITVPIGKSEAEQSNLLTQLKNLKRLGVSDIVAFSDSFSSSLTTLVGPASQKIGPYHIFNLGPSPYFPFSSIDRPLVGFIGESKRVPFKFLELYFYTHKNLSNNYQLVNLDQEAIKTLPLDFLLVNTEEISIENVEKDLKDTPSQNISVIPVRGINMPLLNGEDPKYIANKESYYYLGLEKFFSQALKLEEILSVEKKSFASSNLLPAATFDFSPNGQSFSIDSNEPLSPMIVNYSYSPYWKSTNGKIFRAGEERMLIVPIGKTFHATFSVLSEISGWLGITLSILGVAILIIVVMRMRL